MKTGIDISLELDDRRDDRRTGYIRKRMERLSNLDWILNYLIEGRMEDEFIHHVRLHTFISCAVCVI